MGLAIGRGILEIPCTGMGCWNWLQSSWTVATVTPVWAVTRALTPALAP